MQILKEKESSNILKLSYKLGLIQAKVGKW